MIPTDIDSYITANDLHPTDIRINPVNPDTNDDNISCMNTLASKNECNLIKEGDFANVWVRFTNMIPTGKDTRYKISIENGVNVYTPYDEIRVYSVLNGHMCNSLVKEQVCKLVALVNSNISPNVYIIILKEIAFFWPKQYCFIVNNTDNIWLHINLTSSSENNSKVLTFKTADSCGRKPVTFIKRRSFSGNDSLTTTDTLLSNLKKNSEIPVQGKRLRHNQTRSIDKKFLQKKIKKNMKEWKAGRWVSQQQALAVSYSQTRAYMRSKRARARKSKSRKSRR